MNSISNKEVVSKMYQTFLNQKQFDSLNQFIDIDYLESFMNANKALIYAFPDINFKIKEIFGDGNKIITFYEWSGIHKNEYQKIPPTNKKVIVEGTSIYELKNGKIINSVAKPDKLSFFLQLGLVPTDFLSTYSTKENWIYFVDRFEVPQESYHLFREKLDYNRDFIKKLNGFIKDEVIRSNIDSEKLIITTIAVWKNEQSLNDAKKSVEEEYTKIGFNPKEFNEKLGIKMQREIFLNLE